MDVHKIEIGACYIRNTDKGKKIGFVLLRKDLQKDKTYFLKFAVISFENNIATSTHDFKNGYLFVHDVYSGVIDDFEMGIFCYDVNSKHIDFLKTLLFIGNVKIDKEKFVYGSGTNYTNELFLNLEFNFLEQSKASDPYRKEKFLSILG